MSRLIIMTCLMVMSVHGLNPTNWNTMQRALQSQPPPPQNLDRLPKSSKPTNYDLTLMIDMDNWVFSGGVNIHLEVLESVNSIFLNARDITIAFERVKLKNSLGRAITLNWSNSTLFEIIELRFAEILKPGSYELEISYNGTITDNLRGLYKSRYYDESGNIRYIATTFFAPNYARMVFPCYDEPEFKATFKVSIVHKESYFALSNAKFSQLFKFFLPPGYVRSTFEATPMMSTYLLAFVVSDFGHIRNNASNFYLYSQPTIINDTNLALDYGQEALKTLSEYLDQDYQMPNMQFVAIDDFLMGAMENWGLIMYKTSRIIYNKNKSSANDYQQVLKIVAHELAHQWFGNAKTCSWWSHTWLNEGFASFFEDYITNLIYPEYEIMDQFVISTLQYSMRLDANPNIHAMTSPVNNVDQLSIIYDFVAYKKAASVIRMMQHIVGPEAFRVTMQHYVNSTGTADPDDLFSSFDAVFMYEEPRMRAVFSSWANNPGYPVVTVLRDYTTHQITVSQEHFVVNGPDNRNAGKFYIPLNYATLEEPFFDNTSPTAWLAPHEESGAVVISLNYSTDWVIFNMQQTGYYRVHYDLYNWNAIIAQLKTNPDIIGSLNRAQIIDDVYNLAKSNYLSFNTTLDLLTYIKKEYKMAPMMAAFQTLDFLLTIFREADNYEWLQTYSRNLVAPIFKRNVHFSQLNKTHAKQLMENEIVRYSCKFGVKECLKLVETYLRNGGLETLHPNYRPGILHGYALLASSSNNNGDVLIKRIMTLVDLEDKNNYKTMELNDLIAALGSLDQDEAIKKILRSTIDKNNLMTHEIRKQIFTAIYQSENAEDALNFIIENGAKVKECYGPLGALLQTIGDGIVSEELAKLYRQILQDDENLLTPGDMADIIISSQSAANNLQWVREHQTEVFVWLEHYTQTTEVESEPEPDIASAAVAFADFYNGTYFWLLIALLAILLIIQSACVYKRIRRSC